MDIVWPMEVVLASKRALVEANAEAAAAAQWRRRPHYEPELGQWRLCTKCPSGLAAVAAVPPLRVAQGARGPCSAQHGRLPPSGGRAPLAVPPCTAGRCLSWTVLLAVGAAGAAAAAAVPPAPCISVGARAPLCGPGRGLFVVVVVFVVGWRRRLYDCGVGPRAAGARARTSRPQCCIRRGRAAKVTGGQAGRWGAAARATRASKRRRRRKEKMMEEEEEEVEEEGGGGGWW